MKLEDEQFWKQKRPNGKKPPRYATLTGTRKAPANIIRDTSRFLDSLVDQALDWRPLYRLQLLRQEILGLYVLIDAKNEVTLNNIDKFLKSKDEEKFKVVRKKAGKAKAEGDHKPEAKPVAGLAKAKGAMASPPGSPAKIKASEEKWEDPHKADQIMMFLRSVVYALSSIHFASRYCEDLDPSLTASMKAIFETGQVLDEQTRWALAARDAFSFRLHMIYEVLKRLRVPPEFDYHTKLGHELTTRRNILIHERPFQYPLNYYGPTHINLKIFDELGDKLAEIFNYLCDIYPRVICEEIQGICFGATPKDLKAYLVKNHFDMKGWGRGDLHDASDQWAS